jgi:ectoine hydroxylase-related dioxygenase (phytanoyl-CoA dioxygenase family)
MNPLVLGVVQNILSCASKFQLCTTEMISLNPGAQAQYIHTDELLYDDFVFPDNCVACCNTLWAITDFTEENGATRIVPGSHRLPPAKYTIADTVPAEMRRGSVLIFTGKLWHAGGNNRSTEVRTAQAINYSLGWLRQGENQYLACPPEIARTLPKDLLKVMGYQVGSKYGCGHVGAQADPLEALMMT